MTTLELKLNLSDRLAREAEAAGLLTPKALAAIWLAFSWPSVENWS